MLNALVVGCGGFIGAASRYLLSLLINRYNTSTFPVSTLIINILGSFLIGLLVEILAVQNQNNKKLLLFLTTGILGGFTTFSTFSLETINLYQDGNAFLAILNITLSIVFCLVGVVLGKALARVIIF
jgi:CrcB protein